MSYYREEHDVSRLNCFEPIIDRSKEGRMDSNRGSPRRDFGYVVMEYMMGIE